MTDPTYLPIPLRLALSYAPSHSRAAIGAIFLLDSRLARIGADVSEPIIAQMKLAWWRDQFAKPATEWPAGEPWLETLARQEFSPERLTALVNGWEALIASETLTDSAIEAFAAGRGAAWLAVAEKVEPQADAETVMHAARIWTLADLASHLEGGSRSNVRALQGQSEDKLPALPRGLRPFQILAALGRRAMLRDGALLEGPVSLALAMRVGIFGR